MNHIRHSCVRDRNKLVGSAGLRDRNLSAVQRDPGIRILIVDNRHVTLSETGMTAVVNDVVLLFLPEHIPKIRCQLAKAKQ